MFEIEVDKKINIKTYKNLCETNKRKEYVMNYKEDFPLLNNRDIAYLDSGATTQKPIQVINKVEEFYKNYNANPHRGAYSLSHSYL